MKKIKQILLSTALLVVFSVVAVNASIKPDTKVAQEQRVTSPISGSITGSKNYSGTAIIMSNITTTEDAVIIVNAEESITLSAPMTLKEGSSVTLRVADSTEKNVTINPSFENQWKEEAISLQRSVSLGQNYPNPVKESAKISCYIPENTANALIRVVDQQGNIVKIVSLKEAGDIEVNLECADLRADIYMYSLIVDGEVVSTRRMIVE